MDYFLFDFSGVQFHYTMSHFKFFCRLVPNTHRLSFHFANHLRHSTHRAEGTPGSRLEQRHYHQAKQHRGKHYAVKAKGILRNPCRRATGSTGTAGNASVLVYHCKSFHNATRPLTQIRKRALSRNSAVISRRYNLTQHLVAHVTCAIHTGNRS